MKDHGIVDVVYKYVLMWVSDHCVFALNIIILHDTLLHACVGQLIFITVI